jgi:hypothetical protein
MNATIKTILLTILTLSLFAIALVELSGVSKTALINKYGIGGTSEHEHEQMDIQKRDEEMKKMPKTDIEVEQIKFDFGSITDGDKVRHTWVVKNTGKEPLFISNVQVSCGCTAPFFPKQPIAPGAQGEVTLEFNSAGKEGKVDKNALIIANANNAPYSIGFTADVLKNNKPQPTPAPKKEYVDSAAKNSGLPY